MHPSQETLFFDRVYGPGTDPQLQIKCAENRDRTVAVNEYTRVIDYSIEHRVKSEMSKGEEEKKRKEKRQRLPIGQNQCFMPAI